MNFTMQSAVCVFNYNIGPFTFVTGKNRYCTVHYMIIMLFLHSVLLRGRHLFLYADSFKCTCEVHI